MRLFVIKYHAFFLGALSCYYLQEVCGFSPVLAAATTGFFGSFVQIAGFDNKGIHGAIYAGSFAGMCSFELVEHPLHLILLSLIGTVIYLKTRPIGNGFGGKLGTVSFVSSVIFFLAKSVW